MLLAFIGKVMMSKYIFRRSQFLCFTLSSFITLSYDGHSGREDNSEDPKDPALLTLFASAQEPAKG